MLGIWPGAARAVEALRLVGSHQRFIALHNDFLLTQVPDDFAQRSAAAGAGVGRFFGYEFFVALLGFPQQSPRL